MQKWETKYIVLPLDLDTDTSGTRGSMIITMNYGKLGNSWGKAWEEVSKLAKDGWEPVSMVALTRSLVVLDSSKHAGAGNSITDQVLIMLKRPIG
ncbi:MAG: hypothetical protein HXY35_05485 [Chloroflexi bacterium]|nr:hypothetical protein [Chloroflexota bacterium]